jgi:hypothetical protein
VNDVIISIGKSLHESADRGAALFSTAQAYVLFTSDVVVV